MVLPMNLYAMRPAYFLKLSSSRATSELYWSTLMLAGTPAGYCFNQVFSIEDSDKQRRILTERGRTRPRVLPRGFASGFAGARSLASAHGTHSAHSHHSRDGRRRDRLLPRRLPAGGRRAGRLRRPAARAGRL